MTMYDIIKKKRDGFELTEQEIHFFVNGYTEGSIPDYQASALAMAIVLRGMTDNETATLTSEMSKSGDLVDLSRFGTLSCDKHSTGGVGDKTSLIVAPIVACLGGKVAKMSGRGLGHTGGTVDKLESIPGYRTTLSAEDFIRQVEEIGICIIGQSGNLAPCDKKLYALRDVTATVESIPLITSSIMSKKIAAGAHSIVLDVKTGSGAFMKNPKDAEILADKMVKIGRACGRNTAALITDMDTPLGSNIGNALEVKEAISVLKGDKKGDLRDVCEALSGVLLSACFGWDYSESLAKVSDAIDSGIAFGKFKQWISTQGGDPSYIDNPNLFENAKVEHLIYAQCNGYITYMDAEKIGSASVALGAGRRVKEDEIDMSAGIILLKKTGDFVNRGEPIATLCTSNQELAENGEQIFLSALTFGDLPPAKKPLIYKIIK